MGNLEAGIFIDGTVGVGKTTLVEILENEGFSVVPEPYLDNPVLEKYYEDRKRYAFASQIYFLNKKLELIEKIKHLESPIIDRSIFGDYIFAKMLYDEGVMSTEEFQIYTDLFNSVTSLAPIPKLIIFLDVTTENAIERIRMRGRRFEIETNEEYWYKLNQYYKDYFSSYDKSPVLKIDVNRIDFKNNLQDREFIINSIKSYLYQSVY